MQQFELGMHLNKYLQRMCQMCLRLISFKTTDGRCAIYLPIPLNPLISFSFLQASATETSSSWSLGWKNISVRKTEMTVPDRSEGHLLINLTICPDGGGHCERHQCHCGKQTLILTGNYRLSNDNIVPILTVRCSQNEVLIPHWVKCLWFDFGHLDVPARQHLLNTGPLL